MSTAVEKGIPLLNGHTNGHNGVNGNGIQVNGDSRNWEEQFLPDRLVLDDHVRAQKVESHVNGMVLCGEMLRRVGAVFEDEVERGLRQEPSSLQMENTYVPELPNGTEEGVFLALDLGGTNFRVLLLELKQGQLVREDVKHYHISDALRLGPGKDLFNFLADSVLDFLQTEGMENEELSLGFTFSFPMRQHSISSGTLITWTKSFKCGGLTDVDIAALLQRSLNKRGLKVTVRVLLNDTTGTLVAGAMIDPRAAIGVILGTGSNGCYMERASRVQHWEAEHTRVQDVCVDVEWGAFGDNGCIDFVKTKVDREVDDNSLLVNSFTFEKCIGGKYLGTVLSVSLTDLARVGLFPGQPAPHSLQTADLSLFEEEALSGLSSGTLEALRRVCPAAEFTADDVGVAQYVAHVISNRAAQLASVCIAALLRRMDRPFVGVAVDGSVYKRHPTISGLMEKYIALLAPRNPFRLFGAEDGSGKGSALTAAIAARIAARSS